MEELRSHHLEVIQKLQEYWACERHSKDNPVYCWQPPGGTVCYKLSYADLAMWAVEVVSTSFGFLNPAAEDFY